MALGTIEFFSQALRKPTHYNIILPNPEDVGPGPYPVLLQLHGMFDSYTSWITKSNLLEHVVKLPLIIVMPDGGSYFWADTLRDLRYESLLVQDLWNHINATFPVRKDKKGNPQKWAIGGLSMGGLGALRIGMKHPDKFCSIYGHSSWLPTVAEMAEWDEPLPPAVQEDLDCYKLAEKVNPKTWARMSFDCGKKDGLLDHSRRFHDLLDKLKLPHTYLEHPGAHTWDYWDKHVRTALKQHAEVFGI